MALRSHTELVEATKLGGGTPGTLQVATFHGVPASITGSQTEEVQVSHATSLISNIIVPQNISQAGS